VTHPNTLVALLLLASTPALAQQQPGPDTPGPPVVVTTGEGVVEVVPDRAWITITAESRAGSPREAQKRNADAMAPVLDKLKAAGVPVDAIKTVGYDQRIDAHPVGGPVPVPRFATAREQAANAADSAAPPISAGQIEIRVQVTVTSVLK
jgi:uncharacterized protein YggE